MNLNKVRKELDELYDYTMHDAPDKASAEKTLSLMEFMIKENHLTNEYSHKIDYLKISIEDKFK